MPTLTIPKKMIRKDNLVVIPKEDYERFLRLEQLGRKTKGPMEFAIEEGLQDLRAGRITPRFLVLGSSSDFLRNDEIFLDEKSAS